MNRTKIKKVINIQKSIIKVLFLIIYLIFIFIFIVLGSTQKVQASTKLIGINNFPSSYRPYLQELARKHPNWSFIALNTGLDWSYVISQENKYGVNLVPKNYSDTWKNTKAGQYNVEIDKGWVDSSRQAVEFCMDPRNFLNEARIFQFETLSYDVNSNSLEGIEKILYGTEFYNKTVSYLNSSGKTISMTEKYSDLILKAAKTSKVSPYHLASRIKQEVGPFLSHNSISGKVGGYKGLYNFYNIGATSSTEPMGAIKNGLQYAKDGKGASAATKTKYLIPWNTKEKAITGGAIFIGSSYINVGQNTIYLQKFDVNNDRSGTLFTHQYMTNVLAPYSESKSIYNGYNKAGLLNTAMTFIIPVYNNMPSIPTQNPNIKASDFARDNTRVYCNAEGVNIRTGPSTSYEVITTISKNTNITRIGNGKQAGERWDEVLLNNGIVGYIYQTYVTVAKSNNNAGNNNGTNDGNTNNNANNNNSNNTNVEPTEVTIGNNKVVFDKTLTVNDLTLSGIDYTRNTVKNLKDKITTNLDVEVLNYQNKTLKDTDKVGTGSKIQFKENGRVIQEYQVIVYGDVNGDGEINSIDLLVLQRHILRIKQMDAIFRIAGNINRNGNEPSSVDLLIIQRHILRLQSIRQ